jgi:NTP pyrophosphatase (non-canonical NTP hydrolase)
MQEITKVESDDLFKLANDLIKKFGTTHQSNKACEEFKECIFEIKKRLLGDDNLIELQEEIADCMIVLCQLIQIYFPADNYDFEETLTRKMEKARRLYLSDNGS